MKTFDLFLKRANENNETDEFLNSMIQDDFTKELSL